MVIKDLVDLFKSLGDVRTKRRDKTVALLEQTSKELDSLASCWSEIATLLATEPVVQPRVQEKLRQQRGYYEALLAHLENASSGATHSSPIKSRLLESLS